MSPATASWTPEALATIVALITVRPSVVTSGLYSASPLAPAWATAGGNPCGDDDPLEGEVDRPGELQQPPGPGGPLHGPGAEGVRELLGVVDATPGGVGLVGGLGDDVPDDVAVVPAWSRGSVTVPSAVSTATALSRNTSVSRADAGLISGGSATRAPKVTARVRVSVWTKTPPTIAGAQRPAHVACAVPEIKQHRSRGDSRPGATAERSYNTQNLFAATTGLKRGGADATGRP
jgi:hypothetical protein